MLSSTTLITLLSLWSSASAFMAPATQHKPATALFAKADDKRLVTAINSVEEYADFLREDERLCVVKFYAGWCKSCKKFDVKYRHLARDVVDIYDTAGNLMKEGDVRFAEMEFGANAQLCRQLEVKKLPSIHMYKGELGLVQEFPCGPKKFPIFEDRIARYRGLNDEELDLELRLEDGRELGDQIAAELHQEHAQQDTKEQDRSTPQQ